MGKPLTHKQGGLLFKLTLRKFWEHATPPTVREASDLISLCLDAVRDRSNPDTLARAVEAVRRWFPDFDADDLQPRFGRGHKRDGRADSRQSEDKQAEDHSKAADRAESPIPQEPAEDHETEGEAETPQAEPVPSQDGNGRATALQERIEALIRAGIEQLLIVGPAGCGKTTCATLAADGLGRVCTLIPCNLGTPAYTFTGRRHPINGAFEATEYTEAYGNGGIVILDEVDKLDPSTAAAVNASLANGHLATPDGPIPRHPETVVIATANTWGNGADRQYCGSNQLDAATLDRFAGGRLEADYDPDYESRYDPEVVRYCQRVRDHIKSRHLRRVCSTRMVQACSKLKAAGLDWRQQVTADWADTEREGL